MSKGPDKSTWGYAARWLWGRLVRRVERLLTGPPQRVRKPPRPRPAPPPPPSQLEPAATPDGLGQRHFKLPRGYELLALVYVGEPLLFLRRKEWFDCATWSPSGGWQKPYPEKQVSAVAPAEMEGRRVALSLVRDHGTTSWTCFVAKGGTELWCHDAQGARRLAALDVEIGGIERLVAPTGAVIFSAAETFLRWEPEALVTLSRGGRTGVEGMVFDARLYVQNGCEEALRVLDFSGRRLWGLGRVDGMSIVRRGVVPAFAEQVLVFYKPHYEEVLRVVRLHVDDGRVLEEAMLPFPGWGAHDVRAIDDRYAVFAGAQNVCLFDAADLTLRDLGKAHSITVTPGRALWIDKTALHELQPGGAPRTLVRLAGEPDRQRQLLADGGLVAWADQADCVWTTRLPEAPLAHYPRPTPRRQEAARVYRPLWQRVQLLSGVREFLDAVWAQPDPAVERVQALFTARPALAAALESRDLRRIEKAGEAGRALAAKLEEACRTTVDACNKCGRQTLRIDRGSRRILHGNPLTPASDTEVEFDADCSSCGAGAVVDR